LKGVIVSVGKYHKKKMNGRLLDGKKYEKVSVNSGLNKFFCYICGLKCLKCETPKKTNLYD